MAQFHPPVGFHFKVEVLGLDSGGNDSRFSEVSGLSVETVTEEYAEGGENRFAQKYPGPSRYAELVLKRGMRVSSALADWMSKSIRELDISPKNVDVMLLNQNHEPLITWHLVNAYPTKWTVSDFNANQNEIVVETLQMYYQYFTIDKS